MSYSYAYIGWLLDRCDASYATEAATSLLTSIATSVYHVTPPAGAKFPPQFANFVLRLFSFPSVNGPGPNTYSEGFADMDGDLQVDEEGNAGGTSIYRLKEGIERFLITDINNPAGSAKAQSNIAIMFDTVATLASHFNHIPGGSNVLYMDGHVEFMRYEMNGPYPCNGSFALLLGLVNQ